MTLWKLDKTRWRVFFDRMSKGLTGTRAEIEVASLDLGSQIEAKWLPLIGIVYDHRDDIVEIALENVDHMIHKPQEIYVEDGPRGLVHLEVVNDEGVRQIIKLREPLMLPPPEA